MRFFIPMLVFAALLVVVPGSTIADDAHGSRDSVRDNANAATLPIEMAEEERARRYFTDLPVLDQNGREMKFFSEVLHDRIVLVTLFYTECTGMCPITNQLLSEVQDLLGRDYGKRVFLISISLDPETDTPDVLRRYAKRFGARSGWIFLTGEKVNIERITYRLGQVDDRIEAHNPFLMLGNVAKAHWVRLRPNIPAQAIAVRLQMLADEH